jgi:hypothetical protein
MIASDVAVRSVSDFARSMREAIPDGFALAVLIPRALDLKRRCGRAPVEILWETNFRRRRSGRTGEPWRNGGRG